MDVRLKCFTLSVFVLLMCNETFVLERIPFAFLRRPYKGQEIYFYLNVCMLNNILMPIHFGTGHWSQILLLPSLQLS